MSSGRDWRIDASIFIGLCALTTFLFAVAPLDLAAAKLFYCAACVDHWPRATHAPWSVLYRLAPWITASLVIGGLAGLIIGMMRQSRARHYAVLVLLSVALGPGLLINGIFKDHWNRPRPRDIVEFGGPLHYVIAPLRGAGGASFPCGHCAVGFLWCTGWWICRGRRPRWAVACAAAGLITGSALGVGRMAAGGHFLSDVIWSALLALGVAHALYHYVLRIPALEAHEPRLTSAVPRGTSTAVAVVGAGAGIAILLALFATPHGIPLASEIPLPPGPPLMRVLDVHARKADVDIIVLDSPADRVRVTGELHGFGLPGSELFARARFDRVPLPTLHYQIEQHGWFTDLDGLVSLRVPADGLQEIIVGIDSGNIRIIDGTRAGVLRNRRVHLVLRTGNGHVQAPDH